MAFKNVLFILTFTFFSSLLFSESLDENMTLGIKSYESSKFLDSIHYFNLVLDQDNEYKNEALFWKAKSYYNLGYYNESKIALEDFFRTSDINTSYYEDGRFLYCKIYFKIEKYNDALLLFNQFSRNKSFVYYNKSVSFWIGECYLQLSQLTNAKKSFMEYLKFNSDSKSAQDRIKLINSMEKILIQNESVNIPLEDKADWFVEYVILEKRNKEDKSISSFLDQFQNKHDFFKWIDDFKVNKKIIDIEIEPPQKLKPEIPKIEEVKELNMLEKALLDDLEFKLLNKLGDGN